MLVACSLNQLAPTPARKTYTFRFDAETLSNRDWHAGDTIPLKWSAQEDFIPTSSKIDVGLHVWIVGPVSTGEEALEWVSSGKDAVFTYRGLTNNHIGMSPDTEFELPQDLVTGLYGVVQEVQTAASNYKAVTYMKVVK